MLLKKLPCGVITFIVFGCAMHSIQVISWSIEKIALSCQFSSHKTYKENKQASVVFSTPSDQHRVANDGREITGVENM